MTEIRNLLFQPLTFQLAGEEHGLHLGSRQRKLIDDSRVSDEIRVAAKRGYVILSVLDEPEQTEEQPAVDENIDVSSDYTAQPNGEPVIEDAVQTTEETAEKTEAITQSSHPADEELQDTITDEPRSKRRR